MGDITVGTLFKDTREAKGLTLDEAGGKLTEGLPERLTMTRQGWWNIEQGKSMPSIELLIQCAIKHPDWRRELCMLALAQRDPRLASWFTRVFYLFH
jgi:transcriptional regulator with XRE-family HTH domain